MRYTRLLMLVLVVIAGIICLEAADTDRKRARNDDDDTEARHTKVLATGDEEAVSKPVVKDSAVLASEASGAGAGSGSGSTGASPVDTDIVLKPPATRKDLESLYSWADFFFKHSPEAAFMVHGAKPVDVAAQLDASPFKEGRLSLPDEVVIEQFVNYATLRVNEVMSMRSYAEDLGIDRFNVNPKKNKGQSFVERVIVRQKDQPQQLVLLMGDLHGSAHALLRNLLAMLEFRYINNDFSLAENVHLVFLGDLADRGLYGIETIYTILRLKNKNWDRVHIVRGNHENYDQNNTHGFFKELFYKYGKELATNIQNQYLKFCQWLPSAVFLGVHDDTLASVCYMLCCHGGLAQGHDPSAFLYSNPEGKRFVPIDAAAALSYQWNDACGMVDAERLAECQIATQEDLNAIRTLTFTSKQDMPAYEAQSAEERMEKYGKHWFPSRNGGGMITIYKRDITKILAGRNIFMMVRGHQDIKASCKFLVEEEMIPVDWRRHPSFAGVMPHQLLVNGVRLPDWPNHTTLSTATEGRLLSTEGFMGIVFKSSLAESVAWVYDTNLKLPQNGYRVRNGGFVKYGALPEDLFSLDADKSIDIQLLDTRTIWVDKASSSEYVTDSDDELNWEDDDDAVGVDPLLGAGCTKEFFRQQDALSIPACDDVVGKILSLKIDRAPVQGGASAGAGSSAGAGIAAGGGSND